MFLFNRKATTVMEYMTLVVFLLGALLVFKKYIINGFSGQWKQTGDSFGFGKQYDPRRYGVRGAGGGSMECFLDFKHCRPDLDPKKVPAPIPDSAGVCPTGGYINTWIDQRCYRRNCDCTLSYLDPAHNLLCLQCLSKCRTEECGSDTSWDWPPPY